MTNTPKPQVNKTISEILLQYNAKLRHGLNELNGYGTALDQATKAITKAMLDALPEKMQHRPGLSV